MYLNYQIIKILEDCLQNMNCFSWIKLVLILIHFKYGYYNMPFQEFPCLPCHLFQTSLWPTEIPLQRNPHHALHWFPFFVLPPFDHTLQLLNVPELNNTFNNNSMFNTKCDEFSKTLLMHTATPTISRNNFLRLIFTSLFFHSSLTCS